MGPGLAMTRCLDAIPLIFRVTQRVRRLCILGGLSICLLGCGSHAQDPVWLSVKAALTRLELDASVQPSIAEQQEAIRQAVALHKPQMPLIMMTLENRGAVATLGLLDDHGGRQTWADASGITITLQSGVVVETRGLGNDRIASDVQPLLSALSAKSARSFTRKWRELDAAGVLLERSAECTLTFERSRYLERCDASPDFENWYGTSSPGMSSQWLGAALGYLQIERLN